MDTNRVSRWLVGVNREYFRLLFAITIVIAVGMRFSRAALSGLLIGFPSPFGLLVATAQFVVVGTVVSYYRFGLLICFLVTFTLGVSSFVTFRRPPAYAGDMGELFLSEIAFVAFASSVIATVGFSIGRSARYWRNTRS